MTLTTERVPSGRRGAALVALVLVAVIGVLIARPWDPRPSPSPVAVADSSPAAPSTEPPPIATPEPTRVFVLPTPDFAPVGPGGEAAIVTPTDMAVVQCEYGRRSGDGRQLASLEVQPPMALLDPGSSTRHITRIGWRFDVETNRLQNIFDRAWRPTHTSAWQVAPASSTRPAAFNPLRSRFAGGQTVDFDVTAVRVRIVIEWYTRNDEVAGRAELMPHTYREGNSEFDGEWEPFCRAVI